MDMTVQDILVDAMGLIGATAIDETPTTSELNVALRAANVMIGRWSSQHLLLRAVGPLIFTLTPGKASYNIGLVGADITEPKIIAIKGGTVTDNSIDFSLEAVSIDLYNAMQNKSLVTARPIYVAYDPGYAQQANQIGTIYFYSCPDKAYTVNLDTDYYLTEFNALADNVTFEPAYYEAIVYNLATRLFRRFHSKDSAVPEDIMSIAAESLKNLKNMNSVPQLALIEIGGASPRYNVFTDGYN